MSSGYFSKHIWHEDPEEMHYAPEKALQGKLPVVSSCAYPINARWWLRIEAHLSIHRKIYCDVSTNRSPLRAAQLWNILETIMMLKDSLHRPYLQMSGSELKNLHKNFTHSLSHPLCLHIHSAHRNDLRQSSRKSCPSNGSSAKGSMYLQLIREKTKI